MHRNDQISITGEKLKSKKKSKRKSKYAQKQRKMKQNNPKPMGHCKSSVKGKAHSNTGLPQETRKKSNK